MIRNLVFDMGGVLYRWEPETALRLYPGEDGRILYGAVYGSPDWRRQDSGEIDEDGMIAAARARLPDRLKPEAARLVRWYELTGPVPGMEELARDLSERGYPLFLLSNVGFAFHKFKSMIPAFKYFTGEFISAEHGLLKPDPEIFRVFLGEFGLRAEESLFVDDVAANIEGAQAAGMEGIVFEGAENLRKQFRKRGIL
ncbi:MAG: HAD family phosphatase [Clostridia bacterium]|nr:HAD family phosphatase [Clostridia bacterium]